MVKHWWKILGVGLVLYTLIYGLIIEIPDINRLHEAGRNLFFHVPMWFCMIFMLLLSVIYSIKYLRSNNEIHDATSMQSIVVGIVFGLMGFATGCVWGDYSWGNISSFLTAEPKVLASMIGILIYIAYVILRGSINEDQKRARVSAVFNIFAFVLFNVFIVVIPRLTESLHPGNGGNPGFNIYDSDNNLKMVFYPAVIGWILIGVWMMNMRVRMKKLEWKINEQ